MIQLICWFYAFFWIFSNFYFFSNDWRTVFFKILKCLSLSLSAYLCIHFYWLSWLRQASHRKLIQNSALRRFKILTCPLLQLWTTKIQSFQKIEFLVSTWLKKGRSYLKKLFTSLRGPRSFKGHYRNLVIVFSEYFTRK